MTSPIVRLDLSELRTDETEMRVGPEGLKYFYSLGAAYIWLVSGSENNFMKT